MAEKDILVSTTENIAGYEVSEVMGVVSGSTVRAKNLGKDIMASLKNLVGGEIQEYTEMLIEARQESTNRMIKEAKARGADGVIVMRFVTSSVATRAAEYLAYGTAVKLRKISGKSERR